MDVTRILGVITRSGSLLLGVPAPESGWMISRCRLRRDDKKAFACFLGTMVSVEPSNRDGSASPAEYTCRDRRFSAIEGTFGTPIVGKRLYAGRPDGYHEVTTPVVEVFWMDRDRAWVIPILMHTYRAQRDGWAPPRPRPGAAAPAPLDDWRVHLIEQPFEEGFEGIDDDETLTRNLRRRYELRFLEVLARRRNAEVLDGLSEDRRGAYMRPRSQPVPQRELETALLTAAGEGMLELRRRRKRSPGKSAFSVSAERSRSIGQSLEAYEPLLGRRLDEIAPPQSRVELEKAA